MALVFVISDFFATGVRVRSHPRDSVSRSTRNRAGELVASLFIVTLIAGPISTLSEVLDQTQAAVSAWRKVLHLIDSPVDVADPDPGLEAPRGAVRVDVDGLNFSYRVGPKVLIDVITVIPAGTNVAVVGETGSGKTTFAKLLCRLADPQEGSIRLNGVEIRELSAGLTARDGANGSSGRIPVRCIDRGQHPIRAARRQRHRHCRRHRSTGIEMVDRSTPRRSADQAGERGSNLSVGERQLVALDPRRTGRSWTSHSRRGDQRRRSGDRCRADRRDPEAFRGQHDRVDRPPIGNRRSQPTRSWCSTGAELAQIGSHAELVAQPGIYARLHLAWVGRRPTVERGFGELASKRSGRAQRRRRWLRHRGCRAGSPRWRTHGPYPGRS